MLGYDDLLALSWGRVDLRAAKSLCRLLSPVLSALSLPCPAVSLSTPLEPSLEGKCVSQRCVGCQCDGVPVSTLGPQKYLRC